VVLALDATLTAERVLTGTANQVILTDNGANSTIVLSLPQNIDTGATVLFSEVDATTANFADLIITSSIYFDPAAFFNNSIVN
jgi:hypothetical protein